jgi:3-deoxy-7-phosphoheptulonate synthase
MGSAFSSLIALPHAASAEQRTAHSTQTTPANIKTRHFGTIISELTACLRIHAEQGSRLGGVSLEFTGEVDDQGFSVTECVGGSMGLAEEELGLRYQTFCDPRLNFEQSLGASALFACHPLNRAACRLRTCYVPDVAFLVSNYFKNQRTSVKGDVLYEELGGRRH